jgi:hypothetical protein
MKSSSTATEVHVDTTTNGKVPCWKVENDNLVIVALHLSDCNEGDAT